MRFMPSSYLSLTVHQHAVYICKNVQNVNSSLLKTIDEAIESRSFSATMMR